MPPAAQGSLRFSVPPDVEGERLDRFLTERTDLTRSQVQRLIRAGRVRVDGAVTKAGFPLVPGALVEVDVPEPAPTDIVPEPIPLSILYEDESILVVNKPPGLVVHPGAGVPSGTLVNALVYYCTEIEGVGGLRRPGIVHRLDKDTSGVLIAAKTHRAYTALVAAIAARSVRRVYAAVVWGLVEGSGVMDAPIGRDPHDRKRMAVVPERGKPAVTEFRTRGQFDFVSTLELTLQTGRTHQIRVHLAARGNPVFGDPAYGGRERPLARLAADPRRRAKRLLHIMRRQALHAESIELLHPASGRPLFFEAPPPEDFLLLEAALREWAGRRVE